MARKKRQRRDKAKPKDAAPPKNREKKVASPGASVSVVSQLISEKGAVAAIFLVALLLRVLNLLQMKANSPFYDMPSIDSALFDSLGMKIAEGDWLGSEVFYYNPLYSYFLGVIYSIFGQSYTLVKSIQVFLGACSCVLMFYVVRRLFSFQTAVVAGFITAAYGLFVFYDELLLAESITIFFLMCTTHLLLRGMADRNAWHFVLAGITLGLSFLARPTVMPFVSFVWLAFALRKEAIPFLVSRIAVFGVASALMILPVTVRNYVVGDDFVLVSSHTGYNFWLGNNEESNGYLIMPKSAPRTATDHPTDQRDYFKKMAEEAEGRSLKPSEVNRYWTGRGWDFIFENPVQWLGILGNKFIRLFNEFEFSDNQSYYFAKQFSFVLRLPLVGFGIIVPLAFLGMILGARRWRELSFLYLFVIGYTVSLLAFFTGARYRMLFVPFLIMFAAQAVVWIVKQLNERRFDTLGKALLPLAVFGYLAFYPVPNVSKDPHFIDYYNLGNKYLNKRQFHDAVDAYKKSIDINPTYLSSQNNLASAYMRLREKDKAIDQWKKVLRLAKQKRSDVHIRRAQKSLKRLSEVE